MKPLLASLAASAVMMIAGCSTTSTSARNQPLYTDGQLEQMVKTQLQADGSIGRLNLVVHANAEHNAVELTGTAYTEGQRLRAVNLAKQIAQGVSVADKIEVKPAEVPRDLFDDEMMRNAKADAEKMGDSIGTRLDDAWIHTKIVAKLVTDKTTPERKINVDVMDNIVTLRGIVPSAEARQEAGQVATSVEGVKEVHNKLTVQKG